MIEITNKVKPGTPVEVLGKLSLPYEQRQKRWLHAHLVSGEQVALRLRRGETLRGGDLLAAPDGGAIEVSAAPEKVLHVECSSPLELARAAYHLGNRHAAVQLGNGFLRISRRSRTGRDAAGPGRESDAHRGALRTRSRRLWWRPAACERSPAHGSCSRAGFASEPK